MEVAFEVFRIANRSELFSSDEQSEIKKCQFIVAQIVAGDNEELFNEFWEIINMNNDFLVRYEENLIRENTERVTERVSRDVSRNIAKSLKDVLSDEEIAKRTGLTLETVKQL